MDRSPAEGSVEIGVQRALVRHVVMRLHDEFEAGGGLPLHRHGVSAPGDAVVGRVDLDGREFPCIVVEHLSCARCPAGRRDPPSRGRSQPEVPIRIGWSSGPGGDFLFLIHRRPTEELSRSLDVGMTFMRHASSYPMG